jgi:hypothetical protein
MCDLPAMVDFFDSYALRRGQMQYRSIDECSLANEIRVRAAFGGLRVSQQPCDRDPRASASLSQTDVYVLDFSPKWAGRLLDQRDRIPETLMLGRQAIRRRPSQS